MKLRSTILFGFFMVIVSGEFLMIDFYQENGKI